MPQSLARILVHAVFSTKERRPFLQKVALRLEVHCYLGGILKNQGCEPIEIGGVEDHVHILSFQDEFRRMLARYQVPYDERYVWD